VPDQESIEAGPVAEAQAILDAAPRTLMLLDATGRITWINPAGELLARIPRAELVGRDILDFVAEEDVALVVESIDYLLARPGTFRPMEFRYRRADGHVGVAEAMSTNRLDDPRVSGIVVQVHDVTERRLTDEVLELIAAGGSFDEVLRLLANLLEAQLGDCRAIVGVDPHLGRFMTAASSRDILDDISPAARQVDEPEAGDAPPGDAPPGDAPPPGDRPEASSPPSTASVHAPWTDAIDRGEPVLHADLTTLDQPLRDEAAALGFEACWVFPVLQPVTRTVAACLIVWRGRAGAPSPGERVVVDRIGRLLSLALERRRAQELLLHAARHDALTGLPNRSQFYRHLNRELRRDGPLVGVLYLDLDGFKPINDRYGHRAGDFVLAQIARRIEGALRPRDLTARLGGDEFGVLCAQLRDEAEAVVIAERLITAVADPIALPYDVIRSPHLASLVGSPIAERDEREPEEPVTVSLSVSIGIAYGHQSGRDDERLVELADAAMYRAKAAGRGTWSRSPAATENAD
jgi:diguanylate cyclase (GGDEF)-like protein/PAS domain S-box-containing protein